MQGFTLCVYCDLFDHDETGLPVCAAFPDGIPTEIIQGDFDHREPFEGDGDITFVPKADAPSDEELDKFYAATPVEPPRPRLRVVE
jgi:hypothetical protein